MNTQFDLFYRAYESYKKEFEKNRDNILFKKVNYAPMKKEDFISSLKVECKVEEDWINAIERGVYYIAKAIKEDRQFIRNEGDVLPIEKIRRVSKDSITDLSKHSNYITKKPEEGANVIPEKLLMINRESDYAIYENRVIYTILLYLREFVGSRVDTLNQVLNKYEGKCHINKSVEVGERKLDFQLDFVDVRLNDEIAIKNNKYYDLIQRLTRIYNDIIVLLGVPLMQEMAKHPTVSRPIIKTNVLKMNTNFKESLACYDYICAYEGQGFELTVHEDTISPLTKEQQDSFADIMLLSSFLSYQYTNNIETELAKNYEAGNTILIRNEAESHLKHLEKLLKESKDSDKEVAEYLGELEVGYKELKRRIAELEKEIKDTNKSHEITLQENEELRVAEIRRLELDHEERVEAIIAEYEERIKNLIDEYEEKIRVLTEEYETKIQNLIADYEQQIADLKEAHAKEIEEMQEAHAKEIADMQEAHANEIIEINNSHEASILSMQDDYGFRTHEMQDKYETEIATLKEENLNTVNTLTTNYETQISEMTTNYESQIEEMKTSHEAQIEQMTSSHDAEILEMTTNHDSLFNNLKDDLTNQINVLTEKNNELEFKYNDTKEQLDYYSRDREAIMKEIRDNELTPLEERNEALRQEVVLAKAEVFTMRLAKGEIDDKPKDYTAAERFNQLEDAKNVLDKFFKEAWKIAKQEIKQKHYTVEKRRKKVDE